MEFSNKELAILHALLEETLSKPYAEVNKTWGSMTIEDMLEMKHKLYVHLVEIGVFEQDEEWLA